MPVTLYCAKCKNQITTARATGNPINHIVQLDVSCHGVSERMQIPRMELEDMQTLILFSEYKTIKKATTNGSTA